MAENRQQWFNLFAKLVQPKQVLFIHVYARFCALLQNADTARSSRLFSEKNIQFYCSSV